MTGGTFSLTYPGTATSGCTSATVPAPHTVARYPRQSSLPLQVSLQLGEHEASAGAESYSISKQDLSYAIDDSKATWSSLAANNAFIFYRSAQAEDSLYHPYPSRHMTHFIVPPS